MFKKLRDRVANKKGFTLVELIVVIVIILVMAAVMIPNVIKYTKQASEASTKEAASNMLTEVQLEIADLQIASKTLPDSIEYSGVKATRKKNDSDKVDYSDKGTQKEAQFYVNNEGQITKFAYRDGKHWANWSNQYGWALDGNNKY